MWTISKLLHTYFYLQLKQHIQMLGNRYGVFAFVLLVFAYNVLRMKISKEYQSNDKSTKRNVSNIQKHIIMNI